MLNLLNSTKHYIEMRLNVISFVLQVFGHSHSDNAVESRSHDVMSGLTSVPLASVIQRNLLSERFCHSSSWKNEALDLTSWSVCQFMCQNSNTPCSTEMNLVTWQPTKSSLHFLHQWKSDNDVRTRLGLVCVGSAAGMMGSLPWGLIYVWHKQQHGSETEVRPTGRIRWCLHGRQSVGAWAEWH